MNIGIIGSGNMGGALANLWAEKGHRILITSTSPEQTAQVVKSIGSNVVMGTTADAAAYGDVVVFAFPYESLGDVISKGGSFKNKIIIDLINPLTPDAKDLLLGFNTSASEEIAKLLPEAKVVKAFNTVASPVLQSGSIRFNGTAPDVYYCGGDDKAKAVVQQLIEDIGFEAVESGPLTNARFLEPMAEFVIQLAMLGMGADIALKVLRRKT
jgi:8-hydroxy-5-deazaflavin:NADPH oxidoreductase